MSLALFVLALYIFLESAPVLHLFTVDPTFTAFVGLIFVIIVIVEGVFYARTGRYMVTRP